MVVVLPFLTFKFPNRVSVDPATTSVTPCPPPVMVRVAVLPELFPICRIPELMLRSPFASELNALDWSSFEEVRGEASEADSPTLQK